MGTLADSLVGMANDTAKQGAHTVGDAMQAYHIAATAQNAREQLDIQKQENERNKGNWLASQLSNLQKFDGQPEAQKFLLEGLKRQLPTLAPGVDPNSLDLLGKDATARRAFGWKATQALQNGEITEDTFGSLVSTLGSPQAVAEAGQHIHDEKMKVEAAQAKADTFAQKNLILGDRNSEAVAKDYQERIKPHRMLQEDISRVEGILNTKDKNGNPLVTSQQLGDANLAISRIFSPNHQSDSTVDATEYAAISAKWAAAMQKLQADPRDIGARNLVNHIIDQAHHIGNVTNQNALKELDDVDAGNQFLQQPSAKQTAQGMSYQLRGRFSRVYPTVGGPTTPQAAGTTNASAPLSFDQWKSQQAGSN